MTIIELEYYKCAVCGNASRHENLISTSSFGDSGWSDLDFRPSRLRCNTPGSWLQSCSGCGYIAENIEEEISDEIKSFVQSDEYKKLNPTTEPGKYKALLSLSLMKGDYSHALLAARYLVWEYDDLRENLKANEYRQKALEILDAHGEELTLDLNVILCIMADFHRRCGDFEKVIQFCRENSSTNKDIQEILQFEAYLASQKDSACHDIGEAKKYCAEHPAKVPSLPNDTLASAFKVKPWTCTYCGHEDNTSQCCPDCGEEAWMCPSCHHKWNIGDVCDNCHTPKPTEDEKNRWSCPECHQRDNTGKVCRHCGSPKPELQTWECPYCHHQGNTEEECSKCGFSYWDIHDPMAVSFYEITELLKL